MSEPAVDVVIVSYRSRELLGRCLESLREHPAPAGMSVTVDIDTGRQNTVLSSLGLSSRAAEPRK